jgi:hypothetical protein
MPIELEEMESVPLCVQKKSKNGKLAKIRRDANRETYILSLGKRMMLSQIYFSDQWFFEMC